MKIEHLIECVKNNAANMSIDEIANNCDVSTNQIKRIIINIIESSKKTFN